MDPSQVPVTGKCGKCQAAFAYVPMRTTRGNVIERHVCDACRRGRKNWLNKKWKAAVVAPVRNRTGEERAKPNEFEASRAEIARKLGLNHSTVEMAERSALAKIRRSPELQEAFRDYAEAGMPRVKELVGALIAPSADVLLEYQMQVADFWAVYDRLKAEAAAMDVQMEALAAGAAMGDMPLWVQRQQRREAQAAVVAELREILMEITRFQSLLAESLK